MNPRRLYRCRHDRQLAGVAGGMAEYFDLDPTVVRILWILSVFAGGFSILVYVILAFVVPLEPDVAPAPGPWPGWTPTWGTPPAPGAGTAQTVGPDAASASDPAATPDGSAPSDGAPVAPPAWGQPAPSWGWAGHHEPRRGDGRIGLAFGVLLIVFGAIALAEQLLPALVGHGLLGAGFVVAVGVALVVGSMRTRTADR